MTSAGYYQFPTIHGDTIVFVCEDDLWTVPASGGIPRRLTTVLGAASSPFLSRNGRWLAFSGREEGRPEVYVLPSDGGTPQRLTYLGASRVQIVGWHPEREAVLFDSNADAPFAKLTKLFAVSLDGELDRLPYGAANHISFGPAGRIVLGRHTRDPARWKRYRGGTCGQFWIDRKGNGRFDRLPMPMNVTAPMWIGERIYFLSDHEGIGNLYSCTLHGDQLRRHTHQEEYYARSATTDGSRIVYHSGADLFVFDPSEDASERVRIEWRGPRVQHSRRFVSASKHLETYRPHPRGHSLAVVTRGKPFTLGNWHGPVIQHGEPDGEVRYRLADWLHDGKRIAATSDASGEEELIVFAADGTQPPRPLALPELGRPVALLASPASDQLALQNHRGELLVVDLQAATQRTVDKSRHGPLRGLAWSPDGSWLAYGYPDSAQTSIIKLCRASDGATFEVTKPVLIDLDPHFDPSGRYLYFLSHRVFDPIYDNLHFDLGFPRGMRPYLVTLTKELRSPFQPEPEETWGDKQENASTAKATEEPAGGGNRNGREPLRIDLDGIDQRVVPFPVPEGKYSQVRGLAGNKVAYLSLPVEGSLDRSWVASDASGKAALFVFDLKAQKQDQWLDRVTSIQVTADGKTLVCRFGRRLRVLGTSGKPAADLEREPAGPKSGWVELDRLKVSVKPSAEWRQMYREAWRLQRDHFWAADMSGVDWQRIYDRYLPLLDRISSRGEFSDLMWEMQGELGTSHAYEIGGDYRPTPDYPQGFLAAEFRFDASRGGYVVERVLDGDSWDPEKSSPLQQPGVDVRPGDLLLAINGRALSNHFKPQQALVHQAATEVSLTVARDGEPPKTVVTKTLKDDTAVRYRNWVNDNARYVEQQTAGRAGYVHIPDMGPRGYAEFHRRFLVEARRDALIVDVRFNGGGHVSQLILEKLLRQRIGYDVQRWGEPDPYPANSVLGPIVALTNEQAGSDGDIFSHCFKLFKRGPLIGRRTWGGVIGISPKHRLVDGSLTTQPEFSFWFQDVGWKVENYGTDPDIDVDIAPQDYAAQRDPQLERAIAEVVRLLQATPMSQPLFGDRPVLTLPKLPK